MTGKIIFLVGLIIFWLWLIITAIEKGELGKFIGITIIAFIALHSLSKVEKLEDRVSTLQYLLDKHQEEHKIK